MSKPKKVILSGRVEPELKEDILQEAESFNMTTSSYLEYLLENRYDIIDKDEDYDVHLQEEEEIFRAMEEDLEEEGAFTEVEDEKKSNTKGPEAETQHEEVDEKYFPFLIFSNKQEEEFKEFLGKLWKEYPELS